jgi:NAD(P)-dependent dehydrogenase (short-subunit alcohol dehydrogenase family)
MVDLKDKVALIVGAGAGLSASIARSFAGAGMKVALAARSVGDLGPLTAEIGATAFTADAADREAVKRLFADVGNILGDPYAVVYNASYHTRGPFVDLDPTGVEKSLAVNAFAGFLVAQEAARRMLPKAEGAILFTGASASVKGYPQSAPFAMGKFALRGAQHGARACPSGVRRPCGGRRRHPLGPRPDAADRPDATLDLMRSRRAICTVAAERSAGPGDRCGAS